MMIIELELHQHEMEELKRILNNNQNIITMEILKQIEEKEYQDGFKS